MRRIFSLKATLRNALSHPKQYPWHWVLGASLVLAISAGALLVFYPKKARSGVIMVVEEASRWAQRPCEIPVSNQPQEPRPATWPPAVIAHAGGGIHGLTYTNSLEAMDLAWSQGCSTIEVDLELTSDERLVLLHDWGAATRRIFGPSDGGRPLSAKEFLQSPRTDSLSSLDETSLLEWLRTHPRASVVLDAKRRSIEMMARLFHLASPSVRQQLIAQAYQLEQVDSLARIGFDRIILTLYRIESSEQDLLEYLAQPPNVLAAVAMPSDLAFGPLGKQVVNTGIPTLTHPINSRWLAQYAKKRGMGVYSSSLCGCSDQL